MLLFQFTIVFPFLAILASAQSETYPDCCAALRTKGLSDCDFDFLGSTIATTAQTACVCSIDGIDTPLNQCITCIRATPELAGYADSYAAICSGYQTTTPALGDNSTSTTTMTTMTDSASASNSTTRTTTTRSSTTTTRAPTTASTTTHVAVASAVENENDAIGGNVPSIMLAALAVLAQIGL